MSANHRPPSRTPQFIRSRPLRLIVGGVIGIVLLALLVSPVLIGGGTPAPQTCVRTLRYESHPYVARAMPTPRLVQSLAIGIGVLSGCGSPPENIDVRSLAGVPRGSAIGIPSDTSSLFVRRGICANLIGRALWVCLVRRA